MNNALGELADLENPAAAVATCAVVVIGTGLLGLASRPLRGTRTGLSRDL